MMPAADQPAGSEVVVGDPVAVEADGTWRGSVTVATGPASTDTQADASHLIATLHGVAMARASLTQFPWPPLADAVHNIVVRLARL